MTDVEVDLDSLRARVGELADNAATESDCWQYPATNVKLLQQLDLHVLGLPRDLYGTASGRLISSDLDTILEATEVVASGCTATAQLFMVHVLSTRFILSAWSHDEAVQQEVAGRIRDGAMVASLASEPNKAVGVFSTTATPTEGGYLLNGTKHFSTGSGADPGLFWVTAVLDADEEPKPLMRLVVPSESEGITHAEDWDAFGQRGTTSGTVSFTEVFVPQRFCVRADPSSNQMLWQGIATQAGFSAIYTGAARGALRAAAAYVGEQARPWPTSGVERSVDDPFLQLRVGEMAVKVEAASALLRRGGEALMRAERGEISRGDAAIAIALGKCASTEAGVDVTSEIFRVMGARSASSRFGFDRYWRDVRTLTLHDPVDRKYQEIGRWHLTGDFPTPTFYS